MAESEDNNLTPQEMQEWLQQELRDLTKAFELRVRDAADFVTAYALGNITVEQAMGRLSKYEDRWGDSPIRGVSVDEAMTNEQILKLLDERRERSGGWCR
jgi:hypothetical protein